MADDDVESEAVDGPTNGPDTGGAAADPAIEFRNLTKYYGPVRGIEDVSFDVGRGEIFGFLGPNGAGKSTAIRTLLGFLEPTSGDARLLGQSTTDRRARARVLADVGYVPGDVSFYDGVTGRRTLDFLASLRGDERRAELEARFPAPFDRVVEEYSRGNRQKLALVQAFMHDPSVVVMDEPTSGLDPLVQNEFYDFLDAERERGVTVLFSSHILSEVRRVCDRVAVVREGRLVAVESVSTLLSRGGKVVQVRLAERPPVEAFALDGVADAGYVTGHDGEETLRLLVTGGYDALLDRLAQYTVEDLDVRETSLDDVFLHFYTGDDSDAGGGDSTATDDGTDGAGTGDERETVRPAPAVTSEEASAEDA